MSPANGGAPPAPPEPERAPVPAADAAPGGRYGPILGLVLSGLYLTNPGFGWVELIPDALPVVGNLDEVGASGILFYCLQQLRARRQD